jgi:hypothetical protein
MPQAHIKNTAGDINSTRGLHHVGNVVPVRVPDPAVCQDLKILSALMPENYRRVFELRWLDRSGHSLAEIAEIVGSTAGKVRSQLEVCTWNCHRAGQHEELPAIRRLLGPDRNQWAAKAWAQADRWEQTASRMAETRLLLAIGGMDIPQIQQVVGQYAVRAAALTVNPWGDPLTRRQRAENARPVIDRLLDHTIWFGTPQTPWDPDRFAAKRTLDAKWAGRVMCGYFHSQTLDRMVMYESPLEHETLRTLDSGLDSGLVIEMIEQPFTIPAIWGGRQHLYTPDVIVRLADRRAFVIEVKPSTRLGEFGHWMRWTALARYCELNGYGLYVGNCGTSIIDHYLASHTSPHRGLVRALADEGADSRSDNYRSLLDEDHVLVAQAVTAELLAWEPGTKGGIIRPFGIDLEKARGFWHLIATHAQRLTDPKSSRFEADDQSLDGASDTRAEGVERSVEL